MGSTGWCYFVPYEADVSAALQRLRNDVFKRGDYIHDDEISEEQMQAIRESVRPEIEPWMEKVKELAAAMPEPYRTQYLKAANTVKKVITGSGPPVRKRKRKPKTIKQLLEFQAESGTHSILDIESISEAAQPGAISPFPPGRLVEFFGSETPSHAEIEKAHDSGALEEFVSERGQSVYVVAYSGGSPSEIFFAGSSGD